MRITEVKYVSRAMRLLVVSAIFFTGASAFANTDYPNVVDEPPRSPQEQLKAFHLPAGFEIQLVAAEPDVRKPINFNFDAAGRLWFTASVEYPFPTAENSKGRDCLRIIHGFNADGSATKITTYANDLHIPIGIAPLSAKDAIVFSIPYIYRLRDLDGDGFAEKRETMFGPFGNRDTHGLNNAFTYSIDGWIYGCHGYINSSKVHGTDGQEIQLEGGNVYRFRPDGSHIEFFTHGQVNPFGLAFDPLGNLFSADCHTQPAYLLLRGACYPSFGKPHDGLGFGPPIMNHLHGSTAIAGIACYDADQFPKEYFRNIFVGNPVTHRVNRDTLVAHGSSFEAIEDPDFIVCDDPWFRPVEVKLGPDGALYVADFYNSIIGHYEVPLDHPKRDRERGRIWRVVYKGQNSGALPLQRISNLADASADGLIKALADPNITGRTLATNELVDRIGESSIPLLYHVINGHDSAPSQRAHGLWVLERLGALNDELVHQFLNDSDRLVRVHVVRALSEREPRSKPYPTELNKLVVDRLRDDDPCVQRAASDCLGQHPDISNVKPLLELWRQTADEDVQLIHTIRMALRDHIKVPEVLEALRSSHGDLNISQDDRKRIAELCLGVPTAEATDMAIDYLRQNPDAIKDWGSAIYALVRYASVSRLNDVYDLARSYHEVAAAQKERPRSELLSEEQVVLLGIYRAAQERGAVVPDSISDWSKRFATELLASNSDTDRNLGIELAQIMKLRDARPQIEKIALTDVGTNMRIDALLASVAIDGPASVEMLDNVLNNQKEELTVRQRAARGLGTVGNNAAQMVLLEFLPAAPERLAVEVAAALAKSKSGSAALLATVGAGKASPQLLQEPLVTAGLDQQKIEDLQEKLAKLTEGLPSRDEQIRRRIDDRLTGYQKSSPNSVRGKQIFTKNCVVCHKVGGEGNKIGPELDGVGIRGAARLLEDVLDPNRNVDQAFRATALTTTNGLPVSGLVVREDGEMLVLIDSLGKEQRIALTEIENGTRHVSPMSPMPANLKDTIPEADFYDLIGYLLEQQPKKQE